MYHAFFNKAQELLEQNIPFAMAIVVRAEKPTSGKPGDKALIAIDGTMYGWIGGSCSQPTVIREALKALKDGRSRFIRLSPDPEQLTPRDGLTDFPLTCFSGGTLEIYIEPQYPQPRLLVIGNLPVARALASLGKVMHYDVVAVDPNGGEASDAHHVLSSLAEITDHVRPETYVVVATHGSYDETALEYVLKGRPRYIGLVASRKRFESVLDYLKQQGVDEADLKRIKAPAGLDIQAQQGDEIALSIMAEIVQHRRTTEAEWDAPDTLTPVPSPSGRGEEQLPSVSVGDLQTPPPRSLESFAALPATQGGGEEAPSMSVGTAIDPVCLMSVDVATAKFTYDYEGTTYYFCAPGCKMAFRKNPEEYLHPSKAVDPVCGMEVDTASAQHTSVYHGHTFYFCGPGCKATFDANPEPHLMMHH